MQANQPFQHTHITDLNISEVFEQRLDFWIRGFVGHRFKERMPGAFRLKQLIKQCFQFCIHHRNILTQKCVKRQTGGAVFFVFKKW